MRKIDIEEVRAFIEAQTPETKIYIGGDSERFKIGKDWYADYIMVIVVHINGNNGCKIFFQNLTKYWLTLNLFHYIF